MTTNFAITEIQNMGINIQQLQLILGQLLSGAMPQVLFRDWARRWLSTYHQGRIKTFWGTYLEPVELHLIPYFGEMVMAEILPIDIAAYFKEAGRWYALETLKKDRMCLRGIFETAVENGICARNPVTSTLRLASSVPPQEKHTWTQEQYDTVFDYARRDNYVDIMILMETGITRSELLGLTWPNFDPERRIFKLKDGLVQLRRSEDGKLALVHDGLKNKYRYRAVPVSLEIVERLLSLPRIIYVGGNARKRTPPRKVEPEYIICAPRGGPYQPANWYHRRYLPFMEAVIAEHPEVPPLSPHELRHTRATLLKDQGKDIYSIAKLLGHSDLDMLSKRYAHDNVEALREALDIC